MFLEDELSDFICIGLGKRRNGSGGQLHDLVGNPGAAEVAVATILLLQRLAEIAEEPPRDASRLPGKIENLRQASRVSAISSATTR